jgi:hypothetical protein
MIICGVIAALARADDQEYNEKTPSAFGPDPATDRLW